MNIFSKIVGLILTVLLARYLGPAQLGYFSFVVSVAGALVMIFGFGIPGYIQRHVASRDEICGDAGSIVSAAVCLSFRLAFLSFVSAIILGVIAKTFFGRESAILLFSLAGLYSIPMLLGGIFESVLIALHKLHRALTPSVLRDILRLLLVVIAVNVFRNFVSVVLSYALAFTLYSFLLYRVVREFSSGPPESARNVLAAAVPYLFFGLANMLLSYTDVVMLSALCPISEVGYYRVAQLTVSAILSLLPIAAVSLPTLSRAAVRGELKRKFLMLILLSVLVSALSILLFSAVGPYLILWFFSSQYAPSIPIFRILLFLIPSSFVYSLSIQALVAAGREKEQVVYPLIAGALNIILNYALILRFGVIGAAIATVVSMAVAGFVASARLMFLREQVHA